MDRPIRLTPSLRERVWGKTRLAPWYPDSTAPIGEAWFLSDRDCRSSSSGSSPTSGSPYRCIPMTARMARAARPRCGTSSRRSPGATIAMGFREPLTREQLWEATRTGEVEHLLHWAPVKAGETYFIPAHTVHAIGAGIVLCEIQQNSDVTYRLWDYGRPREIHVEKAVPICDLGVHPGASRAVPVGRRSRGTGALQALRDGIGAAEARRVLPCPQRKDASSGSAWRVAEPSAPKRFRRVKYGYSRMTANNPR